MSLFPKLVGKNNIEKFLGSFDNILTDCDGVLWLFDDVVPGADSALNYMRSLGKKIFFVTNNSTKSRETLLKKAIDLGFIANKEETISTSYILAEYLKKMKFEGKAYVVGSNGIGSELDTAGIQHFGIGKVDTCDSTFELDQKLILENNVKAVCVGYDPHFNITKMVTAATYLNDPSCLFIATNHDARFPSDKTPIVYAGTGSIVAAVEAASGRTPISLGKPHPRMFTVLSEKMGLDPKRTIMIGDNCTTDILLGKNCGLITLSVLTGVHKLHDLTKWSESSDPNDQEKLADYYVNSLGDLNDLFKAL